MRNLVYTQQHLHHSINTARNSQDRTTLKGKFKKLINAKFLLQCALFTDVLAETKHFSLMTQEQDIDIQILDSVENTKQLRTSAQEITKESGLCFSAPNS